MPTSCRASGNMLSWGLSTPARSHLSVSVIASIVVEHMFDYKFEWTLEAWPIGVDLER